MNGLDAREAEYRAEIEGWDWDALRSEAESNAEPDEYSGDDTLSGRVFLGSVFSLYPSGKYYMPFACSNLAPCETCNGRGSIFPRMPRRIERKIRAEHARLMARFDALRAAGREFPPRLLARSRRQYRLYKRACGVSCAACDGLGSREAALDARYGEILESVAEEHGFSVESGEGDPCDIFLTCAVDAPENVEAENS